MLRRRRRRFRRILCLQEAAAADQQEADEQELQHLELEHLAEPQEVDQPEEVPPLWEHSLAEKDQQEMPENRLVLPLR